MTEHHATAEAPPSRERRSGADRRVVTPADVSERRSMVRRATDRLLAARGEAAAARANVGGRVGGLEAPHRRLDPGSRILEKTGVIAYLAMTWLLQHAPARLAWFVGARVAQAGYQVWPKKREWLNANFGHVLGLPPEDPAVRQLALAAYRNYGRYLVDLSLRMVNQRDVETAYATATVSLPSRTEGLPPMPPVPIELERQSATMFARHNELKAARRDQR